MVEDWMNDGKIDETDINFLCERLSEIEKRDEVIQNEIDSLSSAVDNVEIGASIKFIGQMIERQESICDEISAEINRISREIRENRGRRIN